MAQEKSHFTLRAPGVGLANALIKRVLEESLTSFFLGYSDPDEIYDDCWYYSILREYLYDEEGEPVDWAFDNTQERWNFYRDPSEGLRVLSERIEEFLENIIELNEPGILELYDRKVFLKPMEFIFHSNAITLLF